MTIGDAIYRSVRLILIFIGVGALSLVIWLESDTRNESKHVAVEHVSPYVEGKPYSEYTDAELLEMAGIEPPKGEQK